MAERSLMDSLVPEATVSADELNGLSGEVRSLLSSIDDPATAPATISMLETVLAWLEQVEN